MIEDVPKKKERKKEGSEERKKKKENGTGKGQHFTKQELRNKKRDHADSKVQAAKEPHGGGIVTIH